ncbi:MAG: hypothetical protein SX243_17080 [Acidobacteriota bacterium]|nr:hypothetical protein [Acidobacteriota bacterium]
MNWHWSARFFGGLRSRRLVLAVAAGALIAGTYSPAHTQELDANNPGILEPVTSHLQGKEIRVPNTDQSVDGLEQSTIHGAAVWTAATETKSLMGHPITRVTSPNDDMRSNLRAIYHAARDRNAEAMEAPAQDLLDILHGETAGRIYDGFAMLNYNRGAYAPGHEAGEYKMRRARDSGETFVNPFDPEGGLAKIWEVDINLLYYDGQIDSDTFFVRFPVDVDRDDTLRVHYRIFTLVDEDFSPTLVMLDRRQALDTVQFPFKGFDSVWLAMNAGQVVDVTLDYPPSQMVRGIYTWGWREHPPRIQFMQPLYEIRNAHTGEVELDPAGRSYATRNRENLTIANIGEAAPEKKMLRVAEAVLAGTEPEQIERWMTERDVGPQGTWPEWAGLVKIQTQLPDEAWDVLAAEGIERGTFGDYQMVSVFLNNEMYGDGPFLNEIKLWDQGETFPVKLINLDNHTHYFRNVDFGPRLSDDILSCCGGGLTSFEVMNFKGTYGVPKVAEMQWRAGWGFRPHYDVIQQQDVFSRGQDRVRLKPYRSGDGSTYFGYQWSEAARKGDFRFNPPNFIITDRENPSEFLLRDADGENGLVIGQFTEGFGIAQMCPEDAPGFCTADFGPANPNGVYNMDSDGDGVNDELHFPPFLRNPAQGQSGAGDIIPPTGAWRPFLWVSPYNGTVYIDPEDKSKGYWADLTYIHGRPVFAGSSIRASIELPRASGQVFYQFDDLFHDNSIFSPHPVFAGFDDEVESDRITVLKAFRDGLLKVRGVLTPLASGHFAEWVSLYDGPAGANGCTGNLLLTGPVRQEDGLFLFRCGEGSCQSPLAPAVLSEGAPGSHACVQSTVGAFRDVEIGG